MLKGNWFKETMTEELEDYVEKLSTVRVCVNECNVNLLKLEDKSDDSITDLLNGVFREVHSLKATTYYLELDEISELLEKIEDVLQFVVKHKCCITESISEWLDTFDEQLGIWIEDIKLGNEISLYDVVFETPPSSKCKHYTSPGVDESISIVVLHNNQKVSEILERILKTKFRFVFPCQTIKEATKLVNRSGNKILITDFKLVDGNIINLMQTLHSEEIALDLLIVISKFSKPGAIDTIKSKLKLEHVYDFDSTKLSEIKQVCVDHIDPPVGFVKIPINSSKLSLLELSKQIQPLPRTVNELKNACFNDATSIKDVVDIAQNDPVFSGLILKKVNAPFNALSTEVTKVSVAVSLLGKKQIGSMAVAQLSKELFGLERLESYGIEIETVLDVAQVRNNILNLWLKSIEMDFEMKENIIALSFLLPIGMILVDKALSYNNQEKKFKKLMKTGQCVWDIEKQLLGFDRFEALTKLFDVWNIPNSLTKVVKYISNPEASPNRRTTNAAHTLSLAMKTVKFNGDYKITNETLRFVEKRELNAKAFKIAFLKTTNKKPSGNIFKDFDEDIKLED